MNFLEKLNSLMEKNNLNKSTLSKACDIPYTTIDGWYKKGYEGLKLTTLRKLAKFFGTSLDFWESNQPYEDEDWLQTDEGENMANKRFGDRLREARLQKGLTQEQLAKQIGVAKSTLTGYEKGNREPDVFKIKRILEVLDIESDYLLGISHEVQPQNDSAFEPVGKYSRLNDHAKKIVDNLIDQLLEMQEKGKQ